MCTVSWVRQPGGYHLFSNRDERLTRGAAFAPALIQRDGVRFIAPIDADFGGTWLAANEFGVLVCLLNGYTETGFAGACPRPSRGLLVQELGAATSASECVWRLRQFDLSPFATFVVAILEPGKPAIVAAWNGDALTIDPDGDSRMPLTSSSYDARGVRRFRLDEFARLVAPGRIDSNALYRFHTSHGGAPDAYSPCMHRGDAETVSFSWVTVTPEEVQFRYQPSAPCRHRSTAQRILTRAA